VLKKVVEGHGREGDLDLITDLADSYEWTTICAFAPGAAWPVQSFIRKFRPHFDAYVKRNPQHAKPRELAAVQPGAFW
jgi:NADH-quinone oxidoreductase subunit F